MAAKYQICAWCFVEFTPEIQDSICQARKDGKKHYFVTTIENSSLTGEKAEIEEHVAQNDEQCISKCYKFLTDFISAIYNKTYEKMVDIIANKIIVVLTIITNKIILFLSKIWMIIANKAALMHGLAIFLHIIIFFSTEITKFFGKWHPSKMYDVINNHMYPIHAVIIIVIIILITQSKNLKLIHYIIMISIFMVGYFFGNSSCTK